ncbi:UDP-3-O-acyl-N-acetylglucosamine deacetylase [Phycisphaera mikurensis]|uniref:Multifunctional fusion protein n=1 Tax=Phycisphaera mikurensis (strain NBRC 102666 / KCTC 22515 / FYK2301M01) TaxID=1142394 RepID=I0IBV8_PHYMF|nr:UDP-3-O-acyl-N-acetylglucosamine deacetylase [Phycisphaera mikurensis]MBB6442028.1 UDP-3-O-[3-hydroxymyristoyl] N-acetylglucosamine deacetylase/3-hydroxyacyl-[acyl-carrier-protein] dehydratase [Phycisphaera mikurensis]BAM02746.1 UDP-3-O-[3-hydroxymyristoyl] N-acetylglucosamine deacetylase/(3R)-hydroxymyristoyl-[acyl-carrier-protein] dehydratase [Phycisphaera mikurensis NBRC 102666]
METQKTIAEPVGIAGKGLFHGKDAELTFRPAPENHGIVFRRTDLGNATVPALVDHVVKRSRRTALKLGEAVIETCEHVLSAVAGWSIDNLIIDLDAAEVPGVDGSALPFYEAIASAGVREQAAARRYLVVEEPVTIVQDEAELVALPSHDPGLDLTYQLDYSPQNALIGRQLQQFRTHGDDYRDQIAPSRTFSLEAEAKAALAQGLFAHLSPSEVLVIGEDGPLGGNAFRFADEPVRHKILDLLGDLALVGSPIRGRVIARRSGHPLNHELARALVTQGRRQGRMELARTANVADVRRLLRMMPHRYPMLLVDRVLEIDGDRRALGVKNVTINEPFFQGHYPGTPIMPGVLIVEAMAQLSGVLIGQSLEQVGKLPIMLSLDRVKLRRTVTPGDQLILEAEAVRIRSRIAHMRCRAYVAEEVAAEAEVKFMLVDDDQS